MPAVPVSSSWMVLVGLPLLSFMLVAPRMVKSVVLPGLAFDMWIRFVIGPKSTEPVMLNRTLLCTLLLSEAIDPTRMPS